MSIWLSALDWTSFPDIVYPISPSLSWQNWLGGYMCLSFPSPSRLSSQVEEFQPSHKMLPMQIWHLSWHITSSMHAHYLMGEPWITDKTQNILDTIPSAPSLYRSGAWNQRILNGSPKTHRKWVMRPALFSIFVPFTLELITGVSEAFTMNRCKRILLFQLHHLLINRSNLEK